MAYIFNVVIAQSLTADAFFVAEKSVWHYAGGGVWKHPGNSGETGVVKKTLVLNGSGTCGALRFANDKGEYLVVVLGIHNDQVWVDVAADLGPGDVLGLPVKVTTGKITLPFPRHPTFHDASSYLGTWFIAVVDLDNKFLRDIFQDVQNRSQNRRGGRAVRLT
nr:carbohydrate binding protein iso-type lectin a [Hericium erinaceus]